MMEYISTFCYTNAYFNYTKNPLLVKVINCQNFNIYVINYEKLMMKLFCIY